MFLPSSKVKADPPPPGAARRGFLGNSVAERGVVASWRRSKAGKTVRRNRRGHGGEL